MSRKVPFGDREKRLLRELTAYKKTHGHLLVPVDYTTGGQHPYALGSLTGYTRSRLRAGRVSLEFAAALKALGFVDDVRKDPRGQILKDLAAYKKTHGNLLVPADYAVPGTNRPLGRQVPYLRKRRFWLRFCDAATLSDSRVSSSRTGSRPKLVRGQGSWADSSGPWKRSYSG